MKNKFFDSERNKKIYDMYMNTEKSAGEIGKEYKLSESSIRRIVASIKAGTTKHKAIRQRGGGKLTKKEQNEQDFYDNYMKGLNSTSQENKQEQINETKPKTKKSNMVPVNIENAFEEFNKYNK